VKCGRISLYNCSKCLMRFCSDDCRGKRCCTFVGNIEKLTLQNDEFGPVIIYRDPTGRLEIGLMTVNPGKSIPIEVHRNATQFLRIESGSGQVEIGGVVSQISDGFAAVVPSGFKHEIRNTGSDKLKLYTIYSKDQKDKWVH
jgi:mannose-6-phosphate isomerase-like protein (cupin superfamily)